MCSFLSAIPWDRAFHSIYNIRKYLRIYFYFLREFAIFMGIFSILGGFSEICPLQTPPKPRIPALRDTFPALGACNLCPAVVEWSQTRAHVKRSDCSLPVGLKYEL